MKLFYHREKKLKTHSSQFIVLTLAPAIVIIGAFVFIPIVQSLYLGFFRTRMYATTEFIGLDHYLSVFRNPVFMQAIKNTTYFSFGVILCTVVLGLLIALMLDQNLPGRNIFRSAVFLPFVVPFGAYALLWFWLYDPRYGLVNYVLSFFGVSPIPWLQSSSWVIPAFILMGTWKRLGFSMVLFLAGLRTIPNELYEAATIDGAKWRQKLFYVTLPLLSPVTAFVVVITFISSMQLFVEPFVMTKGGPSHSSISIVYMVYQEGFRSLNIGYASAMTVVLFFIIITITLIFMRWFRNIGRME